MDQTRLRSLLAIADHGGFGRAAAALGLAQPSLSRQVALLEQEVGRPLLYRHGRGARLTEDGQRLADAARPLLAGLANLPAALDDPVPRGQVVLGVPTFMSVHLAESIFGELRRRHPQLQIRLVDGFSGFINQWLTEGRLDIAILYDSQRSRAIAAEVLAEEDLLLFARRRRARDLRGEVPVPVPALARLDLVLPDRQHGLRRALQRAGAQPDPSLLLEVDSLSAIRALVERGIGWSVLPRAALTREKADRRYILRGLGAPPLRARLMVAVSPARAMTPALRAVLAHLHAMVGRLQAEGIMTPPADGMPGR
ncbi:LysR family transcriptional regulator [Roseomonas sp. M0104]|uniref:LysR family transcriptional regulator n=1 Tax=Teichococcus coralli TaxID=2545983 RepID=A0A845BNH1_9PROT|nr:LysR substrate-binding domain-containing protein [Pseudoroseomonas coralli]MXP64949.1 LysR family transcriptional regulator [Pseudoroseomonas coralli]